MSATWKIPISGIVHNERNIYPKRLAGIAKTIDGLLFSHWLFILLIIVGLNFINFSSGQSSSSRVCCVAGALCTDRSDQPTGPPSMDAQQKEILPICFPFNLCSAFSIGPNRMFPWVSDQTEKKGGIECQSISIYSFCFCLSGIRTHLFCVPLFLCSCWTHTAAIACEIRNMLGCGWIINKFSAGLSFRSDHFQYTHTDTDNKKTEEK